MHTSTLKQWATSNLLKAWPPTRSEDTARKRQSRFGERGDTIVVPMHDIRRPDSAHIKETRSNEHSDKICVPLQDMQRFRQQAEKFEAPTSRYYQNLRVVLEPHNKEEAGTIPSGPARPPFRRRATPWAG